MRFPVLFALLPLVASFPLDVSVPSIFSRALNDTTQNNLLDGTPCKELTVIFARGTTAPGNVGDGVGPAFFEAIAALIGTSNIAVQGVDYPASIIGFLEGGDDTGSALMANLTTRATTQCPNTKIVVSGYSQGGQLVHKAANLLSTSVSAAVSSVVIFGDPDDGEAVGTIPASKTLVICHALDLICDHTIIVTSEHLNYEEDAGTAADFVVEQAGL